MSTPVTPFGSVERALMSLLVRDYAPLTGLDTRVGGNFPSGLLGTDWYIRVEKIPGGRANSFQGDFVLDLEVFSQDYLLADRVALDLEAILLGHGHHVVIADGTRWVFDEVEQNIAPSERPWDGDDDTSRIGATYVITARRRAGTALPADPTPPIPGEEAPTGPVSYTHTQSGASATWIINHDLGYRPGGARAKASNGAQYVPGALDIDANSLYLTFAEPVSGQAYLS